MTTILDGLDALRGANGLDLGTTDWQPIDSDRVSRFLSALHGGGPPVVPVGIEYLPEFLVLSLTNTFLPLLVDVRGVTAGVNYGTGQVRFPARAPLGARLRARGRVVDVIGVAGGVQTTTRVIVEAEGVLQAVCVVDAISRWLD